MRGLLDDERLDGPHAVHVSFRPQRLAVPIASNAVGDAIAVIEAHCQVWGGATTPIIPLTSDGAVGSQYDRILRGAAIDGFLGAGPLELASGQPLRPDVASDRQGWWGSQFAAALLDYHRQDSYAVLEIVELAEGDPWRPIYAASLGRLPEVPDPALLSAGSLRPELTFGDFLHVGRVQVDGSLDDLLTRLSTDGRITPRQLSMVHLAYGNAGSTSLRARPDVLPAPDFARHDAGPNVIVVCSPGSLDDLALLWNLRAAHGDGRVLPIGIPVDALSPEAIAKLVTHPRIARNGMAYRNVYITSASVDMDVLEEQLGSLIEGDRPPAALSPVSEILGFGYPGGWHREDVVVWHGGRAQITPLSTESHSDLFGKAALSDLTRMTFDLSVTSQPMPICNDVRLDVLNGFFAAGRYSSSSVSVRSRAEVTQVEWPSRSLIARAVASRRQLNLDESEPGTACRTLLTGMQDLTDLSMLAHAPLLKILEDMSVRQGFGWYKERLRSAGVHAESAEAVPASTDDLPEEGFNEFKKALGNSDLAARYWLLWAERAGLIIKGLPLRCEMCRAKQWIPVGAFAPPIVCRGCGVAMQTPFGDRTSVNFSYRLGERLRRVFAQDAIGHLLVARFFDSIFAVGGSGHLVGLHPGIEIKRPGEKSVAGEADVLMLTLRGEFIPVEVKRRATGLTDDEMVKLDKLAAILSAPWSVAVACEYLRDKGPDLSRLVRRHEPDGTYARMVLTYDRLLDPVPIWGLGADPFALAPLTIDEIAGREQRFVDDLARRSEPGPESVLEHDMLHPHAPK